MKHELSHGVRVSAVDNFQGEENDIILLSLVRSNEKASALICAPFYAQVKMNHERKTFVSCALFEVFCKQLHE